jgi:hypothetical protein
MEQHQKDFDARTVLAMAFLILSTWTVARLVSREEYQWLTLLFGPASGAVVGGIYRKLKGALLGIGIGVWIAVVLIGFDQVLQLILKLPPHPTDSF